MPPRKHLLLPVPDQISVQDGRENGRQQQDPAKGTLEIKGAQISHSTPIQKGQASTSPYAMPRYLMRPPVEQDQGTDSLEPACR